MKYQLKVDPMRAHQSRWSFDQTADDEKGVNIFFFYWLAYDTKFLLHTSKLFVPSTCDYP